MRLQANLDVQVTRRSAVSAGLAFSREPDSIAIVDAGTGDGTVNYWANDGTASGEPGAAVELAVREGLFNVLLGDTDYCPDGGPTTASRQSFRNGSMDST